MFIVPSPFKNIPRGTLVLRTSLLLAASVWLMCSNAFATAGMVERLQIVDCLLPHSSKSTDDSRLVSEPRKAIKASAQTCAAKGGEYTHNKQADFSSALKIWQPLAQKGDPEAQFYVGEVYEKGMGRSPDESLAVSWYLRSAENGYAPAQLSLGRMYERGLGVKKNLSKAVAWYQKASNLTAEEAHYSSVFVNSTQKWVNKATTLSGNSAKQQAELKQVDQQLKLTEKELEASIQMVEVLYQEVEKISLRIKKSSVPLKRNSTLIKKNSVPIKGLQRRKNKVRKPEVKEIIVELVKNEPEAGPQEKLPHTSLEAPETAQERTVSSNKDNETAFEIKNIKQLKEKLQQKEKALILANSQSNQLRDKLSTLEDKKEKLAEKLSHLVPEDGPVIALS